MICIKLSQSFDSLTKVKFFVFGRVLNPPQMRPLVAGPRILTSPTETIHGHENPETEQVPVMQRVLDNPFLLLFLGVVVPTVFYILWGIMEVVSIPLAK